MTGINGDGMVNVTFSAEGYADFTTTVELIAGESFVLNVTMEPVTASCESPGDLIVLDITETSARLDWNNVGADLYNVLYKQVGGGNVITSTSNTFLDIEGLDPCSVYKWRVRAVCPDGSKPKSPPGTFFTSGVSCRYVDDSALDVGYELYPNPVVDYAFIKISSDEIQSLRLFNIQAVEMELDYTRSNNLLMINTSALTTGFYFIHLVNQDQKVKTFSFEKL